MELKLSAQVPTGGFFSKLVCRVLEVNSLLCVGLDPHKADLTADTADSAVEFCQQIITSTSHIACCYKPNVAFFEAFGSKGLEALSQVCGMIPPMIPILLDCKRGDIGTTAEAYVAACFDHFRVDAVTVSPYLGADSIEPFLKNASKGTFVLCKTSNPGSNDLQTLTVSSSLTGNASEAIPLYVHVARLCQQLGNREEFEHAGGGVGVVIGATDVDALKRVRTACERMWILAPGIGAQGANLEAALENGLRKDGMGLIIPVSRGISQAHDMKKAAEEFSDAINSVRYRVV